MLNKVNAVTNDLNQSYRRQQTKQTTSSLMDSQIDQLPKLTCDLIRPVLRAEMQNAFVNSKSHRSTYLPISDCLFRNFMGFFSLQLNWLTVAEWVHLEGSDGQQVTGKQIR